MQYTRGVVTLYYRAPEILLGMDYTQKSDMWSLGCIFAELLNSGKPIFPGKNPEHQFELICSNIGFPNPQNWPEFSRENVKDFSRLQKFGFYKNNKISELFGILSPAGQDFLIQLLAWNPKNRMSTARALLHPYLYESPMPKPPDQIRALQKFEYYQNILRKYHQQKKVKRMAAAKIM